MSRRRPGRPDPVVACLFIFLIFVAVALGSGLIQP